MRPEERDRGFFFQEDLLYLESSQGCISPQVTLEKDARKFGGSKLNSLYELFTEFCRAESGHLL